MVNIYKLELTILQQEIFRLLSVKEGETLNQNRIARILGVSPPAIMKALPRLEEKDLIKTSKDKTSGRWLIELNRDNPLVVQLKRADNLKLVYETGLADFLRVNFAGGTIVLFGSYSLGEDTVTSDIDMAVIGRKSKRVDLEKFEKMLERKININFFPSFNEVHKNLRENLFNGIILLGGVEL